MKQAPPTLRRLPATEARVCTRKVRWSLSEGPVAITHYGDIVAFLMAYNKDEDGNAWQIPWTKFREEFSERLESVITGDRVAIVLTYHGKPKATLYPAGQSKEVL